MIKIEISKNSPNLHIVLLISKKCEKTHFFQKMMIFSISAQYIPYYLEIFFMHPYPTIAKQVAFLEKVYFQYIQISLYVAFLGEHSFLITFGLHCRSDFSKNIFSIHFDTILGRLGRERHFFKNMGPFKRKSLLMMALRSPTKRITLYFTRLRMYVLFEYFD